MDDFKKEIQKLDLGDLRADKVKPADQSGDIQMVQWRCGGCFRCFRCFRCGGCGGCGGCFRCGGCFGCFGCFFW
jgi:heterocycloanthracin/sonorensin family bacteriocin